MRIAFFAHYSGPYGANQSLLTLVTGLRDFGVEPLVLAPAPGPLLAQLEREKIEHAVLPFAPWMTPRRRFWRAPAQLWANRRAHAAVQAYLAKKRPDLVYSNSGVVGMGAEAAHVLDLPHLWHLRELPEQAFGMFYTRGRAHAQKVMATSTAFVAVSRVVEQQVLPPTLQARCTVVYNGVLPAAEMAALYPIGRRQRLDTPYRFAMLGSINPNKGQAQALRALALLPSTLDAELFVAGTGGARYVARLQRLARRLGVAARVHFCGFLEDPLDLYRQSDAVLVCSAYEGMGRVTAEAMALGLPVIGAASTGTAELIRAGVTGLLYAGTPEELAQQMTRLMTTPGLAERLRTSAHADARAKFTVEEYCAGVWALCRRAVAAQAPF